jgi:hypothetical protein
MAQLTPSAEIVGAVDTPGGISAVSPEPCGTVAGDQLEAVAQSLLVAPVHVKTAMRASRSSFLGMEMKQVDCCIFSFQCKKFDNLNL